MRAIHKLTPERVQRLSKRPGLHSDGGGLYLSVSGKGARSWLFRYMLDGKAREMGLGSYPEIPLQAQPRKKPTADDPAPSDPPPGAREMAARWRAVKARGEDPISVRESERAAQRLSEAKAMTFSQCAEEYIKAHRDSWRNEKHAEQWTATLEAYAYPTFGDLPVQAVDVSLVHKVLEPIWSTKTETARRVRGRIEAVLDWAKARHFRSGENPARWKGSLESLFPRHSKVRRVRHHPALPYDKLPAFMAVLRKETGIGAVALQFVILTAARTSEAILARWNEIDLEKAVWTVPGERMKSGREHRVPLSEPTLALLRQRQEVTGGKGYVFPGERPKRPISNMTMLKTLERMGRDDLTVHGFRSTFRDWAEERTNFPGSVAEAALAHVVGDKVEAAYRRGDLFDKRRKLMAAWSAYCISKPAEDANVIPMRARPEQQSRQAALT